MARVVVTGGAGFIGSTLVDALAQRDLHGKANEILILDDLSTGREENLRGALSSAGSRLKLEAVDISSPRAAAELSGFAPEVVFHLAAQMNVRRSVTEPVFDAQVNVIGTVNLLEAARLCGCKQFLFASTGGAIYGEQEVFPATESHPIRPESAYGVSKRASELYIEYFSRIYRFGAVALRFSNVYGPRQNPKGEAGVVAIYCQRLVADEPLRVNGDGQQTRDFVYVDDVVGAALLAAERCREPKYNAYNVGLGVEKTILDLIDSFRAGISRGSLEGGKNAIPRDRVVRVEHGPGLVGEQRRSVIDATLLQKELGWKPQVQLDEGLCRTLQSFLVR